MPRGLSKIKQVAAEAQARQAAFEEGGPGVRFFTLGDGESAKVRFCEQGDDVWMVWVHQLPRQSGQEFGDAVLCLDQDDKGEACPACSRGLTRTARVVINLIWYGAPRFVREAPKDGQTVGKIKKDDNGKPIVDGVENCIAVWNCSQTVGGRLAYLHEQLEKTQAGGLTGATITIMRQGKKKQTSYMIDVAEQSAPTAEDRKIYDTKGDPRKVIKSLSFGDMERAYSGGGIAQGSNNQAPEAGQGGMENNAFANAQSSAINRGAFA